MWCKMHIFRNSEAKRNASYHRWAGNKAETLTSENIFLLHDLSLTTLITVKNKNCARTTLSYLRRHKTNTVTTSQELN